jgi:hypothetical protein
MRLTVVCLAIAVGISPAYGQRKRDDTGAVERACGVDECFFEREVRGFEVIDQTHLIVYIGSQRCAFHIELRGTACDLTFAPEIFFREANEAPYNLVPSTNANSARAVSAFELEQQQQQHKDLRICKNDITVQVHGGVFTENNATSQPTDRYGNPRAACQIASVSAITDDQLLELYVTRGVAAPPPPMGAGEIEVGEQEEEQKPAADDGERGR